MLALDVQDAAPGSAPHQDEPLPTPGVPATPAAPAAAPAAAPLDEATRKRNLAEAATDAFGHFVDEEELARPKKRARAKYGPGQHGGKKSEQRRLSKKFGKKVTGDSHESEHPFAFEPINQTSGLKRGTGGRARTLELQAPAYQEVKPRHRDHIGTGTTGTRDDSGMNSHEYRAMQRSLAESGDVSSAVQMCQLGYSSMPGFRDKSWAAQAADDSFHQMAANTSQLTIATGTTDRTIPVDQRQRLEMSLSREASRTGVWPVDKARRFSELLPMPPAPATPSPSPSPSGPMPGVLPALLGGLPFPGLPPGPGQDPGKQQQ